MRARTILLLATPAVIAALAVAVPALAGSSAPSSKPAAAGARASASAKKRASGSRIRCSYTGRGRGRTRICYVPGPSGPRGPRGPRGFVGAHGKRGFTGSVGMTGATGPSGVARAYALVAVKGGVQLVPSMTHEIVAVTPVATGVYCVAPAVASRPSEVAAVVSGESSYGVPGVVPLAVLNAQHPNCNGSEFEVETYRVNGKSGPELSSEVAFTIVAP